MPEFPARVWGLQSEAKTHAFNTALPSFGSQDRTHVNGCYPLGTYSCSTIVHQRSGIELFQCICRYHFPQSWRVSRHTYMVPYCASSFRTRSIYQTCDYCSWGLEQEPRRHSGHRKLVWKGFGSWKRPLSGCLSILWYIYSRNTQSMPRTAQKQEDNSDCLSTRRLFRVLSRELGLGNSTRPKWHQVK